MPHNAASSEEPGGDMLTTWEAAAMLGVSRDVLERMRREDRGPAWIKVSGDLGKGGGQIRYRRVDVEQYLASRTVTPTAGHRPQPYDVPLPGLE